MDGPEEHDPKPEADTTWIDPRKVPNLKAELPKQLLEKTLYQGGKLVVGGSPKARKSWFMMQLCYCIANGLPFLGIKTLKGRVAYVNFELLEGECRERFFLMQKALGGNFDNIDVYQFRGRRLKPDERAILADRLVTNRYVMEVFDPFYKIMPIKSELSEEMSQVLQWIEETGVKSDSSTGVAQHFAKGNQALKHAIDRLSGSNWIARDADCLFIMTELGEEDCQRIDIIHRSFPIKQPFGIRFEHPIFKIDPDINISNIKEPVKEQTGHPTDDRILALLTASEPDGGMLYSELLKAVQIIDINTKKATPSEATFKRRLLVMSKKKLIFKGLKAKYNITSQYSESRTDFYANETPEGS